MGKKLKYTEGKGINFKDLNLGTPELPDLSPDEQSKLWAELGAQAKKERKEKESGSK